MNYVPMNIAVCPDCGGALVFEVDDWDHATGVPTHAGVRIECDEECTDAQQRSGDSQNMWSSVRMQVALWAVQHARMYDDAFLGCWDVVATDDYERYCERKRLMEWEAWARGESV